MGSRIPGGAPFIGINYGTHGNNLPQISEVVKLLKEQSILKNQPEKHVKIFDADQKIVKAFGGKGIKLTVAVTNEELSGIAKSKSAAIKWVKDHKIKDHEDTITSIAMGNEWLGRKRREEQEEIEKLNRGNHNSQRERRRIEDHFDKEKLNLVLAMENIYSALESEGLSDKIRVSTPHESDAQGYPPSAGCFESRNVNVMKSILAFLQQTDSYFMLNVYPFFPYASSTNDSDLKKRIDISYALFKKNSNVLDDKLTYTNQFDAMLDTTIVAMEKVGFPGIPIMITETGWPSGGSQGRGASIVNAKAYNQAVINHVLNKEGTPRRHGQNIPTYLFALFNENEKKGGIGTEEQHFGHFNPNHDKIYELAIPTSRSIK